MTQKHVWLMVGMCLIPLVAMAGLWLFDIPLNGLLWAVLVALCPLSHLAMMWFMPHDHASETKVTAPHDAPAH